MFVLVKMSLIDITNGLGQLIYSAELSRLLGYELLGCELSVLSSIMYKKGLANLQTFFMNLKMVGPAGLEPATKGL